MRRELLPADSILGSIAKSVGEETCGVTPLIKVGEK